jgi:hypothetical protein
MYYPDSDPFTHPRSRIQGSKRHRIPDPQHCQDTINSVPHVYYNTRSSSKSGLTLSAAKSMSSREAEAAMMIDIDYVDNF